MRADKAAGRPCLASPAGWASQADSFQTHREGGWEYASPVVSQSQSHPLGRVPGRTPVSDSSCPLVLAESCQVGVVSSRGWGRDAGAQRDPVTPQSRVRKYDRTGTQGRGPPAAPCPLQSRDSSCVTPAMLTPNSSFSGAWQDPGSPREAIPDPACLRLQKPPPPCASAAVGL